MAEESKRERDTTTEVEDPKKRTQKDGDTRVETEETDETDESTVERNPDGSQRAIA